MKKLEKILGLMFLVSLVLKFNLIVGGNSLISISLILLTLIYYPLGFAFFNDIPLKNIFKKSSYHSLTARRIIGTILLGIGFSAICMGTLFKLLNWPQANLNIIAGLVIIFIALVFSLIQFAKTKNDFYKGIFKRISIIAGFGLIMAITPTITLIKIQFRNHPAYIKAFENYLNNPNSEDLNIKLDIEYHRATYPKEEFDIYMKFEYPEYREK
jgi:hypothetical protein